MRLPLYKPRSAALAAFVLATAAIVVACSDLTRPPQRALVPHLPNREILAPAGLVTVYPTNLHGWSFSSGSGQGCSPNVCLFLYPGGSTPFGSAAASVGSMTTASSTLSLADFRGVRLSQINKLSYWMRRSSYPADTSVSKGVTLVLTVDFDLDDAVTGAPGQLVFDPGAGVRGSVPADTWKQ